MNDMCGKEIQIGDLVVNCSRQSSSQWMTVHRILEKKTRPTYSGEVETLKTQVVVDRRGRPGGRKATIQVGYNCLIIGALKNETNVDVPEESGRNAAAVSDVCATEAGRDPVSDQRWEGIVAQLEANSQSSDKGVFERLAHRT